VPQPLRRRILAGLAASGVALAGLALRPAHAQLTIDIVGSGSNQIPIGIMPFANEAATPVQPSGTLTGVIMADLQRSGRFRLIDAGAPAAPPTEPAQVNFGDWRARAADALVIGSVVPQGGRYEIRFRLLDVPKGEQLLGLAYAANANQMRAIAHRIADAIYEKLTGDKGVFSTRIAYVQKQGTRYELNVADADGFNAVPILISNEPILSPAWSPDGNALAYVSLQNKKPVVYVQRLDERRQTVLANFRGSNSAPAWSPDGRQLAVTLTREGGSQIYLINPDGSNVRRITSSSAIDTEPAFSPDGRFIYFTSDRGGSPQIYRMSASGGDPQRVTFEGSYNVSPRVSADGNSLVYVARESGRFQVAILDLATRQRQILTDTQRDESPSFAPNGKMILYATELGGRGVLAAVSSDGRVRQRLSIAAADVREPAWGPFLK
jgi:TolB protein